MENIPVSPSEFEQICGRGLVIRERFFRKPEWAGIKQGDEVQVECNGKIEKAFVMMSMMNTILIRNTKVFTNWKVK